MSLSPAERAAGLTQPLPRGEDILWQVKPDTARMARAVFRLSTVNAYSAAAAIVVAAVAIYDGRPVGQAIAEATLLLPFWLIGLGVLALLGRMTAHATTYTLTNRRLILHIGIAYEMTMSVPLSTITGAALRRGPDGTGDIALTVKDHGGTGYIALWPHARAWHIRKPQPTLRAVPDVEGASEAIGEALLQYNAGRRVAPSAVPLAPTQALPGRQAVAA